MDAPSQLLIRSALHDLANVLAGVRGILDISDPERPLTPRDRVRLDAVLDEGMITLERSRNLAMELLPDRSLEPGPEWRQILQEQLAPLGTLFKCQLEVVFEGEPGYDFWPGELLRTYVRALTRLALPYVHGGRLTLHCRADAREWRLAWGPVPLVPESLGSEQNPDRRDICSRWALQAGQALGAVCSGTTDLLLVKLARS